MDRTREDQAEYKNYARTRERGMGKIHPVNAGHQGRQGENDRDGCQPLQHTVHIIIKECWQRCPGCC